MTDPAPHLERLGLEQYLDAFIGEGFDTWETLTDIQESDFDALNVKLGHRRKLQRAIAEYRGVPYERLVGSPAQEGLSDSSRTLDSAAAPLTAPDRSSGPAPETKRKYRRHPRPDENAPERPPSAYVIFSNKVREEVKDQNLSFTQIAKLVGDRWQKLDPSGKEPYEAQAAAAKERYTIQQSTYRKTDAYKAYQVYLADFKAKHGQTSEPKRPKLEPESSGSVISARSADLNPDVASQMSGHARGGSMGSVSSSPFIGGSTQVPGSAGAVPSRPPLSSSRSGSPPAHHPSRDHFRPGLISSHSSVSDESSTVRSELLEPYMRTAGLSLGVSASGTPPLPSFAPSASSVDSLGSPDLLARSRLAYFVQQQQEPPQLGNPPPSASESGQPGPARPFQPTLPSPAVPDPSWRNRLPDVRGYPETPRGLHTPLPFPSTAREQLSPPQLLPALSSDRPPDFSQRPSSRILPPPRASSAGASSLPLLGRGLEQPRPSMTEPLQLRQSGRDESRPSLERSESDAANALAGLAAGVSRPDTTTSFGHPPQRPPP